MKFYRPIELPAELCWPNDHLVRAKSEANGESYANIGNFDRMRLGLARRTEMSLFDMEKLKADRVTVDRGPFGGAGLFVGPDEVFYSIHINRATLPDPTIPASQIYHHWISEICWALQEMGVDCRVDDRGSQVNDGVCLSRSGRSEIIDPQGRKLVGSVFKDFGLVVSIHGIVLVTDTWLKIYDYMKVPPPVAKGFSLSHLLGAEGLTGRVADRLCDLVGCPVEEKAFSPVDWDMMRVMEPRFRLV